MDEIQIDNDDDGEDAQHEGSMATALGVGKALRALGTVVHDERSNEISSFCASLSHVSVAGDFLAATPGAGLMLLPLRGSRGALRLTTFRLGMSVVR